MLKLLMNCVCVYLGVLTYCSGFPQGLPAAEPNELQLTTERIIVFKDGYFLVIKRGEAVADAQGQVFTDDVPDAAALGTFWASQEGGKLRSMQAGLLIPEIIGNWQERSDQILPDLGYNRCFGRWMFSVDSSYPSQHFEPSVFRCSESCY